MTIKSILVWEVGGKERTGFPTLLQCYPGYYIHFPIFKNNKLSQRYNNKITIRLLSSFVFFLFLLGPQNNNKNNNKAIVAFVLVLVSVSFVLVRPVYVSEYNKSNNNSAIVPFVLVLHPRKHNNVSRTGCGNVVARLGNSIQIWYTAVQLRHTRRTLVTSHHTRHIRSHSVTTQDFWLHFIVSSHLWSLDTIYSRL
jgi:hypothetical protein